MKHSVQHINTSPSFGFFSEMEEIKARRIDHNPCENRQREYSRTSVGKHMVIARKCHVRGFLRRLTKEKPPTPFCCHHDVIYKQKHSYYFPSDIKIR